MIYLLKRRRICSSANDWFTCYRGGHGTNNRIVMNAMPLELTLYTRCGQDVEMDSITNKGLFRTDCRERGSHARGEYHTQDSSRMEIAMAKQEEEADN